MSEEKMIFQVPAMIVKAETMRKGLRLKIDTYEIISPDAMSRLMSLLEEEGYFTFVKGDIIQPADLLDLPPITKKTGNKSASSRLRSVLYRLWEQDNNGFEESEDHYQAVMEKLINHYKEKLNDM